ncbi:MAG: hypothetical protein NVS1B3_12050 [Candidatus Dormibacteraceae bacterium]
MTSVVDLDIAGDVELSLHRPDDAKVTFDMQLTDETILGPEDH